MLTSWDRLLLVPGVEGLGLQASFRGMGSVGPALPRMGASDKKLAVPSETCGMPASSRGHQGLPFQGSWAREHLLPHSLLLL